MTESDENVLSDRLNDIMDDYTNVDGIDRYEKLLTVKKIIDNEIKQCFANFIREKIIRVGYDITIDQCYYNTNTNTLYIGTCGTKIFTADYTYNDDTQLFTQTRAYRAQCGGPWES